MSQRGAAARLLPRVADWRGGPGAWRADLVAGVTVGVVALPLALAFGITSGMGAAAGLVTAIVAGVVAAIFGGSNVQVSGPTGAMTVVLVPVVHRYGVEAVALVTALAGAIVLLAGTLRLGRALDYMPWPVVEGFTVGIAAIIFLQQVPAALGVAASAGGNTAVVALRTLGAARTGGGPATLGVTLLVVALLVLLPRLRRGLPASLLAVITATATAEIAHLQVARIGALPATLPTPALPDLGQVPGLLSAAVAVAALAALESLLSAKVADGMTADRHEPDRELVGQGLANLAVACFGGMPATGAIARTAVNVRAGARTRLASTVHALVLLAVLFLGRDLVGRIPLAALAGVLMVTAVRMVETHNVRAIARSTRSDALVLSVTALATVAFDLIVAVEIGIAAAVVLTLRHVARAIQPEPPSAIDGVVVFQLDGALFFGAAQRMIATLTAPADMRVAVVRLPSLQVLDATGAQALAAGITELERRGVTVLLKGPRAEHHAPLRAVGVLPRLVERDHLFSDLDDALSHARSHARRTS